MNLQKHFTEVKDFRVTGRCLHELSDILIIVLLGTLADCSDFPEIEDYAKDKEVFLKEELGLFLLGGIPSEDTLSRVVRFLKPTELEKSLRSACKEILETVDHKHIRIDGKEMRVGPPMRNYPFWQKTRYGSSRKCLVIRGKYKFWASTSG